MFLSTCNPIHDDIKILKENAAEIEKQRCQIEVLKKRCDKNEETIDALKGIVSKQQRSLRGQDAEVREKNLIIAGISESDIIDQDGTYKTDDEKINALFRIMGMSPPVGYSIERTGKLDSRFPRYIKMNVVDKKNRTDITKKSTGLKNMHDPWNNVFINFHQFSIQWK